MARRKKRTLKNKPFPFLRLIFILLILGLGYLKFSGINNIKELKEWVSKDPRFSKYIKNKKADPLKDAEMAGEGIIKKLNQRDQAKKEVLALAQEFVKDFNQKEWANIYKYITPDEQHHTSLEEFVEAQNLKNPKWGDPELNEKISKELKRMINLTLITIDLIGVEEAVVKFNYRDFEVSTYLPKVEEIENYDQLDASEVERRTGEIFYEKLINNQIKLKEQKVSYRFKKEVNFWGIEFLKGFEVIKDDQEL